MRLRTKNNSLFRRSDEQKILRAEGKKKEKTIKEKRLESTLFMLLSIFFVHAPLSERLELGKI